MIPRHPVLKNGTLMKDTRGKSFITIIITVAVLAFILRFVVEGIINRSMTLNEAAAQETLKLISAALENYAKANQGAYPVDISALTKPSPPYLDKDYIAQPPFRGYDYSCSRLDQSGYSCSAVPVKCGLTGKLNYNVTTGGIFVSGECSKKE